MYVCTDIGFLPRIFERWKLVMTCDTCVWDSSTSCEDGWFTARLSSNVIHLYICTCCMYYIIRQHFVGHPRVC